MQLTERGEHIRRHGMTTISNDHRNRKLWQDLVDRSLAAAKARGDAYTVASVLNNCGIFEWSPFRAAAEKYTSQLIAAGSTKSPSPPTTSREEFVALLPEEREP
jgi:hypothetical protein